MNRIHTIGLWLVLGVFFSLNNLVVQGQVSCASASNYDFSTHSSLYINSANVTSSYCITIFNIEDHVQMLQIQTLVDYGHFDAYYRGLADGSDWLLLTLEPIFFEDTSYDGVYTFLPFAFGQDIMLAFNFYSVSALQLNVGFTEFAGENTDVDPSGAPDGFGSSRQPVTASFEVIELQRFYEYRIPLPVYCPGQISANVTWDGGSTAVLAAIRGNNRSGLYKAETGSSGLEITYTVTVDDLQTSNVWQLWLANFDSDPAQNVVVNYSTPDCSQSTDQNTAPNLHQLMVFSGHTEGVTALAFSPDGSRIISGSDDDTLILWDVANGSALHQFMGHNANIESVAYAPEGNRVASGGHDGTMRLWNVNTGEFVRSYIGHEAVVESIVFTPDGEQILTASSDFSLILWNRQSAEIVRVYSRHTNVVEGVAINPQGNLIASASLDRTVIVWNKRTAEVIYQLSAHTDEVEAVAFSPDGLYFVTASADRSLILWDANTGAFIRQFNGHTASVEAVTFSTVTNIFASSAQDNTIRIWSINNSNAIAVLTGHTERIDSIAFNPTGDLLASASMDGTIRLWGQ